ncbi:MAG: bifunctional demethylmenaquinone methyltransferase/2-methoxy-6-polyprenyl-1,4-benzoquinol methylase UbiE [Chloroflexi bacterium]|nr:bifunctional demethylmenaquinone methyltransferase/2-methoxy-6-polyprenyl-1,4-benzoquinol methylase UbiE [Chloroflexota bacterium]
MAQLQGQQRARYVQDMFGRIAERYDLMNRLMTLGQDQRWRRYVIRQAQVPAGGSLLDVATGTGDIAFEAVKKLHDDTHVVGTDFAFPMMTVGQKRPLGTQVHWCDSDALRLPFPAGAFDSVVSGYLMRNVIDIPEAFAEQYRVLKPGGYVVCLDTTPPAENPLKPFILMYFKHVIPLMGRLITGSADAYTYLPESTKGFKTADELSAIMRAVGFTGVRYKKFMFSTMAVHVGQRPE